LRILKGPA